MWCLDKLTISHHVHVAVELGANSVQNPGVPVANVGDGYARNEVQIRFALNVIEVTAFRFCYFQFEWKGAGLGKVPEKYFRF